MNTETLKAFRDELEKIAFNDAHAARLATAFGKRVAPTIGKATSQGLTAGSRAASLTRSSALGQVERFAGAKAAVPPPIPAAALRKAAA